MSNVPAELKYAKSHEWLKANTDGTGVIGISDYAQSSLGDITFVQLPKVGATFAAGSVFGVVESVKAASDLYLPVSGTVTEVNTLLDKAPETLNRDPYGEAWIVKIKLSTPGEAAALLDSNAYALLTK